MVCECCGGNKKVTRHHINGNRKDNRAENIQAICVYCHRFWNRMHQINHAQPYGRIPPMRMYAEMGLIERGQVVKHATFG